ncbi:MAG: hypothetical protein HQK52_04675 [Oligoflexia bacterium]|nr:hypothetical protein [Oligoflexia bacterium]
MIRAKQFYAISFILSFLLRSLTLSAGEETIQLSTYKVKASLEVANQYKKTVEDAIKFYGPSLQFPPSVTIIIPTIYPNAMGMPHRNAIICPAHVCGRDSELKIDIPSIEDGNPLENPLNLASDKIFAKGTLAFEIATEDRNDSVVGITSMQKIPKEPLTLTTPHQGSEAVLLHELGHLVFAAMIKNYPEKEASRLSSLIGQPYPSSEGSTFDQLTDVVANLLIDMMRYKLLHSNGMLSPPACPSETVIKISEETQTITQQKMHAIKLLNDRWQNKGYSSVNEALGSLVIHAYNELFADFFAVVLTKDKDVISKALPQGAHHPLEISGRSFSSIDHDLYQNFKWNNDNRQFRRTFMDHLLFAPTRIYLGKKLQALIDDGQAQNYEEIAPKLVEILHQVILENFEKRIVNNSFENFNQSLLSIDRTMETDKIKKINNELISDLEQAFNMASFSP